MSKKSPNDNSSWETDLLVNDLLVEVGLPEYVIPVEQDDVISWIEREFHIPERQQFPDRGMKLSLYQKVVLKEAHRKDADGKFIYDLILWSDIKKSAKSSIAAAVVLYRALHTDYGSFKIVANDLKQADSRVFNYMRTAIGLNPKLQNRCRLKNFKIMIDNRSTIEAIPVDPRGEAGGNDDLIEFTELHAASSKASVRMWSEMTVPPTKHGYAQRWIDTYAGHTGESPILEQLYENGVEKGTILDLGVPGLEIYSSDSMLVLWNTVPRLSWQTPAYYASEKKTLTPEEYDRIHRNQWVSSTEIFVSEAWWNACAGTPPKLDKFREIVVALDGSVDDDCFGIVACARGSIKLFDSMVDVVYPVYIHAWEPANGHKLSYSNIEDPEDMDYPEGVLRWLIRENNVLVVKYDPYQLHDMAQRFTDDGSANMEVFGQGVDRLIADKQLYDMIKGRRIVYDTSMQGIDTLSQHIKNANRHTEGESKLRIVKRSPTKKIDLAVTLSMTVSAALEYLPEE